MKPQPWLAPLTPLYAVAVTAKNALYNHRILQQKKLRAPVISIGNLSTGGGGKTPFVMALAKLLYDAKIPGDILSRGYGRITDTVERVHPAPSSTADQFGDEPLLIARKTGLPVFIGRERYAAGLLAEHDALRIHILDDGFQHRQLARDFDIVLIHRHDLTAGLLPAGHLREPLSSLKRADAIVLRDEDRDLEPLLHPYLNATTALWHIHRRIEPPSIEGQAIAFCGTARPDEFFASLRAQQIELAATIAYPDHHRFSDADIKDLSNKARNAGAAFFLTTEKDLARFSVSAQAQLQQTAPLHPVPLNVAILEAEALTLRLRTLYATLRPSEHPAMPHRDA
jgi:tetraacyldisaccharide 4'-kinase